MKFNNKYVSIAVTASIAVPNVAIAGDIDFSMPFDLAGISTLTEYSGDVIIGDEDVTDSGPTDYERCVATGYSDTSCGGTNCNIVSNCQYDNSLVKCGCYCNSASMCEKEGYTYVDDFNPCVDIDVCKETELTCPYNSDYYSCSCHCDIAQICNDEGYTVPDTESCPVDKVEVKCPYNNYYKNCL